MENPLVDIPLNGDNGQKGLFLTLKDLSGEKKGTR